MPTKKQKIFVFLDTNIHLHFQTFNQIPWENIFTNSTITLIFSYTTLKELEEKKVNKTNKQIAKRADKVVTILSEMLESDQKELRKNTVGKLWANPIDKNHSEKLGLSNDLSDDRLLSEISSFKISEPEGKVLLVTDDIGLRAKAKFFEIDVLKLDAKFKLPPEVDEDKKEIQSLKKELAELSLIKPQLKFLFADGNFKAKFLLKAPELFSGRKARRALNSVKLAKAKIEISEAEQTKSLQALEKLKANNKVSAKDFTEVLIGLGELATQIPASEYDRYNSELEIYYAEYAKYLDNVEKVKNIGNLIIKFSIQLVNNGTAPAEDMDISLTVPDGVLFIRQEEIPFYPLEPEPPEPPRFLAVMLATPIARGIKNIVTRQAAQPAVPSIAAKSKFDQLLRLAFSENRREVTLKIDNLKHYSSTAPLQFHLMFRSFEEAKSFEMNYSILPKNLPHPTENKLHFIIEKQLPNLFPSSVFEMFSFFDK